jgi:hypothetical protein
MHNRKKTSSISNSCLPSSKQRITSLAQWYLRYPSESSFIEKNQFGYLPAFLLHIFKCFELVCIFTKFFGSEYPLINTISSSLQSSSSHILNKKPLPFPELIASCSKMLKQTFQQTDIHHMQHHDSRLFH